MICVSDALANLAAMQSYAQDGSRPHLYHWMHRPSLRMTGPWMETQSELGIPHTQRSRVDAMLTQIQDMLCCKVSVESLQFPLAPRQKMKWVCSAFCSARQTKFAMMSASVPTAQGHVLCLVTTDWAAVPLSNSDHQGHSPINIRSSPKNPIKQEKNHTQRERWLVTEYMNYTVWKSGGKHTFYSKKYNWWLINSSEEC